MIYLGPSGTSGMGYEKGLALCNELKLRTMEVEFTYGVRMTDEDARHVGELAEKNNVMLSVHAPYYINLSSKDKEKIVASKKRILDSCQKASFFYTKKQDRKIPVVFHAGFYQDIPKDSVLEMIQHGIAELNDIIKENKWNVVLSPESTGKVSQFGTVEELLELAKDKKTAFCIDFAHIYARNQGRIDYDDVLSRLPKSFHAHYSGINFGPSGEKNHILVDIEMFRALVDALNKHRKDVTLINESPDPFGDCKKMIRII